MAASVLIVIRRRRAYHMVKGTCQEGRVDFLAQTGRKGSGAGFQGRGQGGSNASPGRRGSGSASCRGLLSVRRWQGLDRGRRKGRGNGGEPLSGKGSRGTIGIAVPVCRMSGTSCCRTRVCGCVRKRCERTGRGTSSGRPESRGRAGRGAFGESGRLQERIGGAWRCGSLGEHGCPTYLFSARAHAGRPDLRPAQRKGGGGAGRPAVVPAGGSSAGGMPT